MSYSYIEYKTACTTCGGKVTSAAWGSDCRGNDSGYWITCTDCKRSFVLEDWGVIAKLEMAERTVDYWEKQISAFPNSKGIDQYKERLQEAEKLLTALRVGAIV